MGSGRCLDMLFLFVFSKILPETKSKRSSSQCTLFPPPSLPKDRGEEKCAKVPRSHWKGKIKNVLLIFLYNFYTSNSLCAWWKCLALPFASPLFLYTSAFWLFSSTFSSSFFSSSEDPHSFSPVFQLPCLFRLKQSFINRSLHGDMTV